MIQDFETIKTQLSELAAVINSFKSEAVQLKIIELVLGGGVQQNKKDTPTDATQDPPKRKPRRKPPNQKTGDSGTAPKKRRTTSSTGAVATLTQLAEGDFFETPRTISDIIEHCRHNLARTFKANEFSGKLGRMVRDGKLTRKQNTENQYEYRKA